MLLIDVITMAAAAMSQLGTAAWPFPRRGDDVRVAFEAFEYDEAEVVVEVHLEAPCKSIGRGLFRRPADRKMAG
ncbi:hypothetical protein J7E96_35340 [Streptomyces sp. ISL-96]|uniref:hypothetical protein n=1 Tax=Streptomyces sp. ISL-96 TaxID=2819191 RepID=UPI001BE5D6AE|nr:hypothetical protein [Streptomyces sp. ISL-96]MBT2493686.1 hypothetical protein [Streptomyces sp. ISL-96]